MSESVKVQSPVAARIRRLVELRTAEISAREKVKAGTAELEMVERELAIVLGNKMLGDWPVSAGKQECFVSVDGQVYRIRQQDMCMSVSVVAVPLEDLE